MAYSADPYRENLAIRPYRQRDEAHRWHAEVFGENQDEAFATIWGRNSDVAFDRAKMVAKALNDLPHLDRLINGLGEALVQVYREVAEAQGIDLTADEDSDAGMQAMHFRKEYENVILAMQLYHQWHDREGVFASLDERHGMPAEYVVRNDGKTLFTADTRQACVSWLVENCTPSATVEPGELVWMRADELKEGDYVDFYGDKYADPNRDPGKAFEFNLAEVETTERETQDNVVIYTYSGNFSVPFNHLLKVKRAKVDEEE